jgi:hypothetical protein
MLYARTMFASVRELQNTSNELKHSVTIYAQIVPKNKLTNDPIQFGNYDMVKLNPYHHFENEVALSPIPFFVYEENAKSLYDALKGQLQIASKDVATDNYPNIKKLLSASMNSNSRVTNYSMEGIPRFY